MIQAIALPLEVTEAVAELEATLATKIETLLHLIGARTIAALQAYTSEMRPPIHVGDPGRRAHLGHWADVTTRLVQGYRYEVEGSDTLVLRNDVEYAAYLEQREGFWVLSGVTDPGGPVEQAIIEAAAGLGLEVTVEVTG
jgi:hypothetical protein